MATKLLTELEKAERAVLADPTDAKAIETLRALRRRVELPEPEVEEPEAVDAWRCAACHELVADGEEDEHAVDCCAFTPEEAYVCPICHGLWETPVEAMQCCPEATR